MGAKRLLPSLLNLAARVKQKWLADSVPEIVSKNSGHVK